MEWIPFRSEKLARPIEAVIDGRKVVVALSPYDIPTEFRAFINRTSQRFIIEFKYAGEEDLIEKEVSPCVIGQFGKNSLRVYSLSFPMPSLSAEHVAHAAKQAFTIPFTQRVKFWNERGLAEQAISENEPTIRSEVRKALLQPA